MNLASKKLIVFDLDGTLAPSKSAMERAMTATLLKLLSVKKVAVIGGGKYSQFQLQLLKQLPRSDERLQHLFLFPTTANSFYRYHIRTGQGSHGSRGEWKNVYALTLSSAEKATIRKAMREVLKEINYVAPPKVYGQTLEDRVTQMSFSPLGQDVVTKLGAKGIRLKEDWKKKNDPLRFKIARLLAKRLPKLEVRVGGITTIDITRKGIDKAYGVRQIKKMLKISIRDMVFIGDALYPGGNDHAARKTGIDCVSVRDPKDTKRVIEKIIAK